MIERQVIDGRPATVAYLNKDLEPAGKDDHTLVRILFDDGEVALLAAPEPEDEDDISDLDELDEVLGQDEAYLTNLGRNLAEAREFKHRPGADAALGIRRI